MGMGSRSARRKLLSYLGQRQRWVSEFLGCVAKNFQVWDLVDVFWSFILWPGSLPCAPNRICVPEEPEGRGLYIAAYGPIPSSPPEPPLRAENTPAERLSSGLLSGHHFTQTGQLLPQPKAPRVPLGGSPRDRKV